MIRAVLAAIPLLVLPVAAYGLLAATLGGGLSAAQAQAHLGAPLLTLATRGGGRWPVSAADLLLAVGLVVAFLDLIRGAADRRVAIANHALSIALFVACLAAMLLAPAFASSTFFLLTLMVLLDLVAGFIVAVNPPPGAREARPRGR
jgi:hypothetical protein